MSDNVARERSGTIPGRVFWLDGRGGMKDITGEDRAGRQTGFVLIALEPKDTDCLDWLTGEFGGVAAAAMMDHEARPHCTVHEDGALIALIADPPALKEAHAKSTSHNARFWIEKGRCVVVSTMAVEDLIGSNGNGARQAPTTPVHVVMRVALRAADRLETQLDVISDRADKLEEEVLRLPTDRTRVKLNQLRRAAIVMRRSLLPQRDALTTLETAPYAWFTARDRARLREAVGWSNRLAGETMSFSERASLVQEQITDRRAEELNRTLLVLAAVTTIFMPLTLLTGLLGMNVAGIPFADHPWAFAVVIVIVVILGILQYLWFRSRKWL